MHCRVLIFGGTGFIGQKVVDALKSNKYVDCKIATRQECLTRLGDEYIHCDMNTCNGINDRIKNEIAHSDIVINMAGEINDESRMWKVNHDAPKAIFEIFKLCSDKSKVWIQLSSCGVFDVKFNQDITVNSPKIGRNNYEKSKITFDDYLRCNADNNVKVVLFYPSVVITESDVRINRLCRMLRLAIIRWALSPDWSLNVVKVGCVVSAILEMVLIECDEIEESSIDCLVERVLNEPVLIKELGGQERWFNISSLSQKCVSRLLSLGVLSRKSHERLLFLFSNVKYK